MHFTKSILLLFVGSTVLFFSACDSKKQQPESPAEPLAFEMKTFRVESEGGCTADTLSCASYQIQYPVFNGIPTDASDSIKKKIDMAVDTGNPETKASAFEEEGKAFVADFDSFKKEFPENAMGWYYRATVDVMLALDTLITMNASNEYFTGGAHGGYGTFYLNIDPRSGKDVTLDDVLKPGYEQALTKIAERIFRANQELSDSTTLADAGYEFSDNSFVLNDNYGFTSEGIAFVFNAYEVAPYALGAQDILVPYVELKEWLKKPVEKKVL